jgi:hypothetical protein
MRVRVGQSCESGDSPREAVPIASFVAYEVSSNCAGVETWAASQERREVWAVRNVLWAGWVGLPRRGARAGAALKMGCARRRWLFSRGHRHRLSATRPHGHRASTRGRATVDSRAGRRAKHPLQARRGGPAAHASPARSSVATINHFYEGNNILYYCRRSRVPRRRGTPSYVLVVAGQTCCQGRTARGLSRAAVPRSPPPGAPSVRAKRSKQRQNPANSDTNSGFPRHSPSPHTRSAFK